MVDRIKPFQNSFHSGLLLLFISFTHNYQDCFCLLEAKIIFSGDTTKDYNFLSMCVFADSLTAFMETVYVQRLPFFLVHLAVFSSFKNRPQISDFLEFPPMFYQVTGPTKLP